MYSKKKQVGWFGKKRKMVRTTADKWFSVYVRLRDTVKVVNGVPYVVCITCGKLVEFKAIQCGHFVKRHKWAVRFYEKNGNAQCVHCNEVLSGNDYLYGKAINKKWGPGTAEYLVAYGNQRGQKKYGRLQLKEEADKYRLKSKEIAKEKGYHGIT